MAKLFLIIFLCLQIGYWFRTYEIKPELEIVPPLPSKQEIAALSFGDSQLYFRGLSLDLQMAGDTFGRSTPLKDYNYPKLLQWFRTLDSLDDKSNYIPSVAAYYFSKSQHPQDVKYIVTYLEEHSMRDPEANWWWLSQSIYLANSVLKDHAWAIRIANELRMVKTKIPLWARQMEAFLREDAGDKNAAKDIMCDIVKNPDNLKDIPKREMDFMIYFFQQRLKVMTDHPGDFARICGFGTTHN